MKKSVVLLALLGAPLLACAQGKSKVGSFPCATPSQASQIRDFYETQRPGRPLPVPGRHFNVPESVIASALAPQFAVGTPATMQVIKDVWKSIDAWGANTAVKLVLTSGGKHAYSFPSLVPITQPDANDGFLDMYADEGKGVHAHINMPYVKAIFAADLPGGTPNTRTQTISFYAEDGSLVLGVYAQVSGDPFDQAAVDGFMKTRALLESLPRICTAK